MQADWKFTLPAGGKDDEKKRKTGPGASDVNPADRLADRWLAEVKTAFDAGPSMEEYEPPIDRHFLDYTLLLAALFKPRPYDKYEIRLYPGVCIRYRPIPGQEIHERTDFDDANLDFHIYYLDEASDDNGRAVAQFYFEREGGSTITEKMEMSEEARLINDEVITAEELIVRIRATRAGITEISMCGAIFESETEKMVFGPFNRVFARREVDAEEGLGDFQEGDLVDELFLFPE